MALPVKRALVWTGLLAAGLALACAPARSFYLEFSGASEDVARIARVELSVFDGASCTCAELEQKAGCLSGDAVATASFSSSAGRRTAGDLPEGDLVLRVTAFDAAEERIPLKLDCACVAASQGSGQGKVILPIGTPYVPAGQGCRP